MATNDRPLSPHIGIYRWQITMTMSIAHRATGIWLCLGALALVYWLLAIAVGPDAYATAQVLFGSWVGQVLMWGWTFCLFYHLCNGIRHLFWDTGRGFAIRTVYLSGYTVWIVAAALTGLTLWLAYNPGARP